MSTTRETGLCFLFQEIRLQQSEYSIFPPKRTLTRLARGNVLKGPTYYTKVVENVSNMLSRSGLVRQKKQIICQILHSLLKPSVIFRVMNIPIKTE